MVAARRVGLVLLAYGAGAWVVLGAARWVAQVLALPPLFDMLLRWGLVMGAVLAVVVAWRFPEIGQEEAHSADPEAR